MIQKVSGPGKWLLVPFYSDPASPSHTKIVNKFEDFIRQSRDKTGFDIAIVDDGSSLDPNQFNDAVDRIIVNELNEGKAEAIRSGLDNLLNDSSIKLDFIVQYDGDGDQPLSDIPSLMDRLTSVAQEDPSMPYLVIGDRYSEGISTSPNPHSVAYRQSILIFFGAISRSLGYEVRDWVSGARAYTKEYAKRFAERSRSSSYGIEAEQLIIAYLEGAMVTTAKLTDSRPRDPHTDTSKWLQNFDAILNFKYELKDKGQNDLVVLLENLTENLRSEDEEFSLDLASIGENTSMQFRRKSVHSADIPYDYRRRIFAEEISPFTIRKEY